MAYYHMKDEDVDATADDVDPNLGEYLLYCSICFGRFSEAKILPCLHSFCRKCIYRHYETFKSVHNGRLVCPTCRDIIDLSTAGINGLQDDCIISETKRLLDELSTVNDNIQNGSLNSPLKGDLDHMRAKLRQYISDINPGILVLKKKIYRLHLNEVHGTNAILQIQNLNPHFDKKPQLEYADGKDKIGTERNRLFNELAKLKGLHDVLDDVAQNASPAQLRRMFDHLTFLARAIKSHFLSNQVDDTDQLEGAVGGAPALELSSQIQKKPKNSSAKGAKKSKKRYSKSNITAQLIFKIGGKGSKPREFDWPIHSFFLPDGSLLVSDKNNNRIQLIEADGKFGRMLLAGAVRPRRVILGPFDGLLYVSDEMTESLRVFDAEERPIRNIGQEFFKGVGGMSLTNAGHLVMTDVEECFVTVHSNSGELISKFTSRILSDRKIPNPSFCTVDDLDRIYVSDFRNSCVKIFKMSGAPVSTTKVDCPRGLAIDEVGNLFVVDSDSHRIVIFSPEGKFLKELVTAADGLQFPISVALGPTGQMAVTQCGYFTNHQLLLFQLKYDYII